jgi:hypothetical protein
MMDGSAIPALRGAFPMVQDHSPISSLLQAATQLIQLISHFEILALT